MPAPRVEPATAIPAPMKASPELLVAAAVAAWRVDHAGHHQHEAEQCGARTVRLI